MRKIFRFKYEPCNGTCYTAGDDFYEGLKKISLESRTSLVNLVTAAHDKLCDNPAYFFGIDKCEKTGLFIGHFVQPSRIDMFSGVTLEECILDICKAVLATNIPVLEGVCTFGESGTENLAEIILSACASPV